MFKKVALTMALAVTVAPAAVAATGSAAWAAENYPQGLRSVNNSQMYMDVTGGSRTPGTKIIQWTANAGNQWYASLGPNQQWMLPINADGSFDRATGAIKNVNSGLCMETGGIAGYPVYQWTCNGSDHQQWRLEVFYQWDWADFQVVSHTRIVNPMSGLVLDVNQGSKNAGASIIVWPAHGGDNQAWDISRL
ncbi:MULTISPECIES: RICIN domain-containing protein [Micromonospora]|uniref:RICIN domain-containing protein n=1 Tax=Micromonospora TaxID=1873 RepID=UPI000D1485A2|nr:RICIN domain-containing protein [Micromonospora sp. MH33]PSK66539.1 hypothetical protein B0E53_01486 [Micromonospora sp. MH33]